MKRRIAIVVSSIARGGGAEKVSSLLATGLTSGGHDVHLITFYSHPLEDEYPVTVGARHCFNENPLANKLGKIYSRAKYIAAYCKSNNIEGVFSFMEEANFPTAISRLFGNKASLTVSVRQDPLVYTRMYRTLIRLLYPLAKNTVAVTKTMQGSLEDEFKLKNVTCIFNPFIPLSTGGLTAEQKQIFKNNVVFLTVGRLTKQKGQWHLINAFAYLHMQYPNTKLIIIGQGDLDKDLHQLVKESGIDEAIHFLGLIHNVGPLLRECTVFVLPSLWEGFPNTLVEALSENCLTIATDCPTGPRELLAPSLSLGEEITYPYKGDHGILVACSPRNEQPVLSIAPKLSSEEQTLLTAMQETMLHPELAKQYQNSSQAISDLTLESICQKWLSLI